MIGATVRLMALNLWRDRPMLALTFILPPLVFLVFTAVFRETSARAPIIEVATLDEARNEASRFLTGLIARDVGLKAHPAAPDLPALKALVASGMVDAGVVIRPGFGEPGREGPAITVLTQPGRDLAGQILTSRLQQALDEDEGRLPADGAPRPQAESATASRTVLRETVGTAGGDAVVAYHAGAIAVMFLMIASVQVAATLVEERESGIYERVASSGPVGGLVLGKFVFGVAQGSLQAVLIMAAAWLGFGLDVLSTALPILVTCVLSAGLASSFTLAVAASCSTRYQAQTMCTFGVLALSAIGGSMVPRLLMPPWLKSVGWVTPNTWAIEAFGASFRGEAGSLAVQAGLWAAIGVIAAAFLALAVHAFAREPTW